VLPERDGGRQVSLGVIEQARVDREASPEFKVAQISGSKLIDLPIGDANYRRRDLLIISRMSHQDSV
jgi:hypothetical protein